MILIELDSSLGFLFNKLLLIITKFNRSYKKYSSTKKRKLIISIFNKIYLQRNLEI